MSSYPPPNSNYTIYNSANFTYSTDSLTIETADSRYLKLTGSIASGLQTLNGGLSVANIYNSGNTFTVPSSSGQLALTSQIPTSAHYVDLTTNQTVAGEKLFSSPITSEAFVANDSGTASACAFSVNGLGNGMYSGGSNQINLAVGGSSKFIITTGSIQMGQTTRFSSGSLANPSITFSSDVTSGFYLPSSSNIGIVINNSLIGNWSSSGLSITGSTSSSTSLSTPLIRPTSGNTLNISRVSNASGGTAELLITPSTTGWGTSGVAQVTFGDSNHYINSMYGYAMQIVDSDNIYMSTPGSYLLIDNGSTSRINYGSASSDPIGDNEYGWCFGSSASGSSFSIYSSVSHTMKIGRNNNGDAIRFYRNNPGAVAVGSISLTTTGTAYNITSDRRLKENIVDVSSSCLDLINQIRVCEFNYIAEPDKTLTGIIAQEIKEILPQVVTGDENSPPDEYGNIDPMMVDYSKIVPFLIKSIQELKALIQPVIV